MRALTIHYVVLPKFKGNAQAILNGQTAQVLGASSVTLVRGGWEPYRWMAVSDESWSIQRVHANVRALTENTTDGSLIITLLFGELQVDEFGGAMTDPIYSQAISCCAAFPAKGPQNRLIIGRSTGVCYQTAIGTPTWKYILLSRGDGTMHRRFQKNAANCNAGVLAMLTGVIADAQKRMVQRIP